MNQVTITRFMLFAVILLSACNSSNEVKNEAPVVDDPNAMLNQSGQLERIKSTEAKLFAKANEPIDQTLGLQMVKYYADYAYQFPNDTLAPEYFFKAGEICSSLMIPDPAITYFKTAYDKYPNYRKAPFCLFMQAFVYENQLANLEKAKEIYQQVIDKYPNHSLANDAKACINNLGKSDEELIKEFEAKNKK